MDEIDDEYGELQDELASRGGYDADQDASYVCWACGEEIVVPVDPTMGERQDYVEDCPVCCRPNELHVELDLEHGGVRCWSEPVG